MRKRKKGTKRKTHHRRRRISGVHPVLMETGELLLGAGVGAVAAVFVNQALKTSFTTAPAWIGGGACVGIGAAIPIFVKHGGKTPPFIMGAAGGMIGMGAVFATNETFLSLPGIAGVPMGLPNAAPGYISQTVGNYKGVPPNRIGNMSGADASVIGAIFSN
jgi:hypothetical protein